jgi:ABC-type branched-subunit amino acid transport system substrate-binding protein
MPKTGEVPDLGSKRKSHSITGLAFFVLLTAGPALNGLAATQAQCMLSAQQRQGKEIYLHGTTASGEGLRVMVGDTEAVTSAFRCASCHGPGGLGTTERGASAGDISWKNLSSPQGHQHLDGRRHPAFTPESLKRAIREGIDPAGNTLAEQMPRFQLAPAEMGALVAYLQCLGNEQAPGVSESIIRIGSILPAGQLGNSIEQVIEGYFDDVNRDGGVYNRRLSLVATRADAAAQPEHRLDARPRREDAVLALVSSYLPVAPGLGSGNPTMNTDDLPVVGPLASQIEVDFPQDPRVFYLSVSPRETAAALITSAADKRDWNGDLAIVYPEGQVSQGTVGYLENLYTERTERGLKRLAFAGKATLASVTHDISQNGIGAVLFLGSASDAAAFLGMATRADWSGVLLLAHPPPHIQLKSAGREFRGKVVLSSAAWSDSKVYAVFAARHHIPTLDLELQESAYCASALLVEGLRNAGKSLTREGFTTALETLREFQTGVCLPLTYAPDQHWGGQRVSIIDTTMQPAQ